MSHFVNMRALLSENEGADVTETDVQWDILLFQRVREACAESGYDPETIRQDWFHVNGQQISASYFQVRLGICAKAEVNRSTNSLSIEVE